MSVRVNDMQLDASRKEAKVSLFADTKSEIAPNMQIPGIPNGYKIAQSSSVMTASAEIAFMKSDGTWNWV